MIDTTQVCCQSTTLFGLINSIPVFFMKSLLKMKVWANNSKAKCISLVGGGQKIAASIKLLDHIYTHKKVCL